MPLERNAFVTADCYVSHNNSPDGYLWAVIIKIIFLIYLSKEMLIEVLHERTKKRAVEAKCFNRQMSVK